MPDIKDLLTSMTASKDKLSDILSLAKKDKYISEAIKEFDLNDDEIIRYYPILSTYSEEKKAEETCSGIEDCSLPTPYCLSKLSMENGILTRNVVCCPCYQKILNRKKAFLYADFDSELFKANIAKLKKFESGKKIIQALAGAKKSESKKWTFVTDDTEKCFRYVVSYLCWCGERKETVAFVNFPALIESLKNIDKFHINVRTDRINALKNVDVLVFSSFGSEYKSDYVRDSFIMPLLRERSAKKKETIFISPYSLKDIDSLYVGQNRGGNVIAKELSKTMNQNTNKEIIFQVGVEESF